MPTQSAEDKRDRAFDSMITKKETFHAAVSLGRNGQSRNRSSGFTMNCNYKLSVTLRGSHDAYRDVDTETWHHEVYTPRDRGLETYNSNSYLFFINDHQDYALRYDGALETYEGWSLEADFGSETFSWVESDRHMELQVTATDTPFNKYTIPFLYPEKHRDPIWPKEASIFLSNFQAKHPKCALDVLLKWKRRDDETSTYFFQATRIIQPLIGTRPLEIQEKFRLQVRKGGRGIQKMVSASNTTTSDALTREVHKRITGWKANHGDWYVATLISAST